VAKILSGRRVIWNGTEYGLTHNVNCLVVGDWFPAAVKRLGLEALAKPIPQTYSAIELFAALTESLKLQAHYAELLNMHDGGQRIGFTSVGAWIDRLRETGTLKKSITG
jgi:hypothetical protein